MTAAVHHMQTHGQDIAVSPQTHLRDELKSVPELMIIHLSFLLLQSGTFLLKYACALQSLLSSVQ